MADKGDGPPVDKTRAVNALCVASSLQWFAMMVSMQAEREILLRAFSGNFAAHARLQSTLSSASRLGERGDVIQRCHMMSPIGVPRVQHSRMKRDDSTSLV